MKRASKLVDKDALLNDFERRSAATKSKIGNWNKKKTTYKKGIVRSKFVENWSQSYKKLGDDQRNAESDLQRCLLGFSESEPDMLQRSIKMFNEFFERRKSLRAIISDQNVPGMEQAWRELDVIEFPSMSLEELDCAGVVPSRVVDICSNWLGEEHAAGYYLTFVELFGMYQAKLEKSGAAIKAILEELDKKPVLHAYARVVCSMLPKTIEHYISKRNELLQYLQPKEPPINRIQACARLEQLDQLTKSQHRTSTYYHSDYRQLEQKVLSEIQQELATMREENEKLEVIKEQADLCVKLHEKLSVMREKFQEQEMARLEEEDAAEQRALEAQKEVVSADRKRRAAQKVAIGMYQTDRNVRKADSEAMKAEHSRAVKADIRARGKDNIERVDYRKNKWDLEQAKKAEELQRKADIKKEMEKKLDKLRSEVHAEFNLDQITHDTSRLVADTTASKGKIRGYAQLIQGEPEDASLFPLQTYTSARVMEDPRMRLESAFRSAGVNMASDYAQSAMARFQKTQPKNLTSTLFR